MTKFNVVPIASVKVQNEILSWHFLTLLVNINFYKNHLFKTK